MNPAVDALAVVAPRNQSGPIIALSGIVKGFETREGQVEVLKGVSLSVDPGEVLLISSPSGGGKSTLLNILGILALADTGTYELDGQDVTRLSAAERTRLRASTLSMIFQRGNLFPHLTAVENVQVGLIDQARDAHDHLARAALRDADVHGIADRRAGLLSGGEQQRVAVARAMARGSRIILADEPTASLDDENAEKVLGLLLQAASDGVSVVIASHDSRVLPHVSRSESLVNGVLR